MRYVDWINLAQDTDRLLYLWIQKWTFDFYKRRGVSGLDFAYSKTVGSPVTDSDKFTGTLSTHTIRLTNQKARWTEQSRRLNYSSSFVLRGRMHSGLHCGTNVSLMLIGAFPHLWQGGGVGLTQQWKQDRISVANKCEACHDTDSVAKPEGKRSHGKPRSGRRDNIKMDSKSICPLAFKILYFCLIC